MGYFTVSILMCVLAFQGGFVMTNDVFCALSESEKANKIKTVLRQRTEDFLTDSEIEMIVKSVRLKTQYCVMVFEAPYKFCGYMSVLPIPL